MNKKYDVLEFYKIINKLIDFAKLDKTKERYIDIDIIKNRSQLDKEFILLSEMLDFYKYDEGLDISSISNMDKYISTMEFVGSYLTPEDLVDLKKNLITYRISRSRAKNLRDKYKAVWTVFSNYDDVKDIENYIEDVVDEEAQIKDGASIGLKEVRRQMGNVKANIKEKFDNLMSDKETSKAIQERIVTKRNDRYVIPIKSEFKSLIKGVEQDRSSTNSTVYLEPLNVVSLNNKLREYESREKEEIRKVLIRIIELIKMKKQEIIEIKAVLEELDFINSKVLYSLETKSVIPKIVNRQSIKLIAARHPLIKEDEVVPIDFELGESENIMLITGPNTGGKTVTLKVTGLLTIMALSGIPIPADEKTEIGIFDRVLADIGDEQSIEQNLSSFSGHVKSIKEILEVANSKSLVLLDELGSGTDPMEGAAFAMSVIDYLKSKSVTSIITTHYSEVKAYAFNNDGIKSASMEFNIETLSPTYRLLEGIPGESNALIIAGKYGISDEIIDKAKSYISEDNQKIEKMIQSIKEKNDELELLKQEIENSKNELDYQKKHYEEKILETENEKNDIIKKAYDDADIYLREIQSKAKNLVDQINKDEVKKEDAKNAQRSLNMLRESFSMNKKKTVKEKKILKKDIDFHEGEEVLVKSLNQNGKILRIIPESNSVQVQAGILKLVVSTNDIVKILKKPKKKNYGFVSTKTSAVKGEIDLRGKTVDEAIAELEVYLDRALLTGYHEIYIIHGKGTMVLRKKVQEYLKASRYISEYKDADQNQGGVGCTVAVLK